MTSTRRRGARRVLSVLALAAGVGALGAGACAQPLAITARNTVGLPGTTTDQHGASFTIAGLSGIAYTGRDPLGVDHFLGVMDNSDRLVAIEVVLAADGAIVNATVPGGLRLSEARDFEGIASCGPGRDSVLLAEEGTPAVHEFDLASGAKIRGLAAPAVFAARRDNFGFESLARGPAAGEAWTANEEALTIDGPTSSPTSGTIVRLLRYHDRPGRAPWTAQYAYVTAPMHGAVINGARSGVCDLVVLPDGRVLSLERSFALASPLFRTRIYSVGFAGATEVSAFTSGLWGQAFTPVSKTLLYSGGHNNLEGLALGPQLPDGAHALIGIVDDGDPVSTNQLVSFRLTGAGPEPGAAAVGPVGVTRR